MQVLTGTPFIDTLLCCSQWPHGGTLHCPQPQAAGNAPPMALVGPLLLNTCTDWSIPGRPVWCSCLSLLHFLHPSPCIADLELGDGQPPEDSISLRRAQAIESMAHPPLCAVMHPKAHQCVSTALLTGDRQALQRMLEDWAGASLETQLRTAPSSVAANQLGMSEQQVCGRCRLQGW